MSWQRIVFIVVVVAALAWVFLVGPVVHTERDDGMNGGQQPLPRVE